MPLNGALRPVPYPTVLPQSLPVGVFPIKADQGISSHIKAYKGSNVFLRVLPSRLVKRSQAWSSVVKHEHFFRRYPKQNHSGVWDLRFGILRFFSFPFDRCPIFL